MRASAQARAKAAFSDIHIVGPIILTTGLLTFVLLPQETVTFAVTRDRLKMVVSPIKRDDIAQRIHGVLAYISIRVLEQAPKRRDGSDHRPLASCRTFEGFPRYRERVNLSTVG